MSVLNMLTCQRCEEKAMRAMRVRIVHGVIILLTLVNTSILAYVSYRLFGAELVCARSALDILDHPREDQ